MDFSALNGHKDLLEPGTLAVARLRQDARELLTQLDQKENLRTETVLPLRAGMWNALYRLEPAGVVAKLSAFPNDFETRFLREAAKLGVKVPQVSSEGTLSHPDLPGASYFLMDYLADTANPDLLRRQSDLSHESLLKLAHDIGAEMAKLHTVRFGYLLRFSERVATWKEVMTHELFSPDWDTIPPKGIFEGELLEDFRRIVRTSGYLDFSDGYLVHFDLNLNNVLVNNQTHELVAIIDPAGYTGMPMFDLAYAAMPWEYGFEYLNALVDSYRQHGGEFEPTFFYISLLVVAYQHGRFHNSTVANSIRQAILPKLRVLV